MGGTYTGYTGHKTIFDDNGRWLATDGDWVEYGSDDPDQPDPPEAQHSAGRWQRSKAIPKTGKGA